MPKLFSNLARMSPNFFDAMVGSTGSTGTDCCGLRSEECRKHKDKNVCPWISSAPSPSPHPTHAHTLTILKCTFVVPLRILSVEKWWMIIAGMQDLKLLNIFFSQCQGSTMWGRAVFWGSLFVLAYLHLIAKYWKTSQQVTYSEESCIVHSWIILHLMRHKLCH